MTYQVLARKWRPQDFASLIGQEPIVTALRNALMEKRVAQAYLFSGIRGVGKTTAARVFAKALNCERTPGSDERPEADPCNDCLPCREITAAADIDVLEIDAATYSKVEQVRELTESLRYGAARDRYKVVVLDEVHRLSRQAFDALLKIVEEPPEHLVFIFATTEIDTVPATILSRCQEFQFRRVPSPVLANHLERIAEAESIEASEAALRMIARAGEGSVRDSVALLDQLATFGGGKISDHDANHLLGGFDAEIFRRLLTGILTGELATITAVVREIEANGWDPQHVYSQFLGYVRDALHLGLGGRGEALDLPLEEAAELDKLLAGVTYESLLQIAQLLLAGELTVRRSEFALLALEITWLRAAELPKITRVEDLLSGRLPVNLPKEILASAAKQTASSSPETPPAAAERAAPPAAAPPDAMPRLREILSQRPPLAARFNDDVRLEFEDGTLLIQPQSDALSLKKALERKANAEFFDAALAQVWGAGTRYEIRGGARRSTGGKPAVGRRSAERRAPQPEPPQSDPLWEQAEKDPRVQTVLRNFPGSITSVQPRDRRLES